MWENFVIYLWQNRSDTEDTIIFISDSHKLVLLHTNKTNFIVLLQKYTIDLNYRFVDNGDGYWMIFGK